MARQVSAVVICQSSLMREAIETSLTSRNIVVAQSVVAPSYADPALRVDVGIVAERCDLTRSSCDALVQLCVASWVIVCDGPHDLLYAHLSMRHPVVSAVPSALTGSDLAHVMHLAAAGHRLCLDDQCPACSDHEAKRVFTSHLEGDQWKLMQSLARGYSNKEIARIEGVTEAAVKARMRSLLGRLRVTNRTQAAVMAARAGLGLGSLAAHGSEVNDTLYQMATAADAHLPSAGVPSAIKTVTALAVA